MAVTVGIQALAQALPDREVSNAELAAAHPDWRMEQVALRTGVLSRRWVAPGETALDLAERACRTLDESAEGGLAEVDALLFCTQSPDHIMPPNACLLHARLGLRSTVAALDYSLACSGFVYGLYLARALVSSEAARRVLLVTAETYSRWMHPNDRGPMTLFGDAAAAVLVGRGGHELNVFEMGTDGEGAAHFCVPAGGARQPYSAATAMPIYEAGGSMRTAEHLHMNGGAVLDFVKRRIPAAVHALLERADTTLDAIDLVVFHQASQVTLDALHRALAIPPSKQFTNLAHVGNTVSASIPMALEDAERSGRLRAGMRVLVMGFGVGLSWGGCVIEW